MNKTYVLDTSVLVHDPDCLDKFVNNSNEVVIPLAVLLELDNLKTQDGMVGFNTRKSIHKLDNLTKADKIKIIPSNLNLASMDLSIIDSCNNLRNGNNTAVVLITKDVSMRVIARHYNISTEDYNSDLIEGLPDNVFELDVDKNLTFCSSLSIILPPLNATESLLGLVCSIDKPLNLSNGILIVSPVLSIFTIRIGTF